MRHMPRSFENIEVAARHQLMQPASLSALINNFVGVTGEDRELTAQRNVTLGHSRSVRYHVSGVLGRSTHLSRPEHEFNGEFFQKAPWYMMRGEHFFDEPRRQRFADERDNCMAK